MKFRPEPTLRDQIAGSDRPLFGMWVCSGSALIAEVCAGSGLDWLLLDMEHTPASLESVLAQLQAVAAYAVTPVVRLPSADPVIIKRVLDLGAQTIVVPAVSSVSEAQDLVQAVRYPPHGCRGVGSALARSARWNRIEGYLDNANEYTSLFIQIETAEGVTAAAGIAAVDGIDGVFVGPSDLAASMGLLGQQSHPDVKAAIASTFTAVKGAGKPVGINVFDPLAALAYASSGASFLLVSADVAMLARGSERLAAEFILRPETAATDNRPKGSAGPSRELAQ